ncbi:hypothetical protein niasHT_030498 [Heterodera trifolii]|uniref:RNA-directed DNA polymerase n=1 Tax=Heterodera trifolii TaxID=157864 RepID=A0ABD2I4I9_9BILA
MKELARRHVFWPGLDKDIENMVGQCKDCQNSAKMPRKAPLHPWPVPDGIFDRIHVDFAGPCQDGRTYLILVDAKSKWPEITQMISTNAASTIDVLNKTFHRYGFPKEMVSDNGPPFSSFEFRRFCENHGIKHSFSPPYQPHCNGLAERMDKSESGFKRFCSCRIVLGSNATNITFIVGTEKTTQVQTNSMSTKVISN